MEEEKLEYKKMRERVTWAFKELKRLIAEEKLEHVSDDLVFQQACEMGRCLFVRSEIAYSGKK